MTNSPNVPENNPAETPAETPKEEFDFSPEELQSAAEELSNLSPADYLRMQKQVLQYAGELQQYSDWLGCVLVDVISKNGTIFHVTQRSRISWADALNAFANGMEEASATWGIKAMQVRQAPAVAHAPASAPVPSPTSTQTVPPAPGAVNVSAPATPPPPPPASSVSSGTSQQEQGKREIDNPYHASLMFVELRPDGFITLKFQASNRKFPDIFCQKWTPEQAVGFLEKTGAWTPEHFQKPAQYAVNFKIAWHYSENLNAKKNPFKDVDSAEIWS